MEIKFTATPESVRTAMQWAETQKGFPRAADKACETIAKSTAAIVKKVIEEQNFKRVPLTPGYIARKKRQGLDPRVLIATKQYLKSYRHYRVAPRNWAVTCDLQKMNRLEFGTGRMPKRPHWEPVIRAMNDAAPTIFAHEVLHNLGLG